MGASFVALLAGCTSSKDPFLTRAERPSEQCMNEVFDAGNPQAAFSDRKVMRYVVKPGDTLWGISQRFLSSPWYWKQLWYDNPQVRNPHLIYPGDVLSVVTLNGEKRITITEPNLGYHGSDTGQRTHDGRKIYKYTPHAAEYDLNAGPISIASGVIAPFLLKARIMSPQELQGLPFVFGDAGDYMTLSNEQVVYAKDLPAGVNEFFVYRPDEPFYDPNWDVHKAREHLDLDEYQDTGYLEQPIVGTEMQYIARLRVSGQDVTTGLYELTPLEVAQPMLERDVLVPATEEVRYEDYFPRIPSYQCRRGYMMSNTNTQTLQVKEFDTVVTSFGADNGAQTGDIWKIVRPGPIRNIDGQQVQIPSKDLGYLMIIKVYDHYSLGFVLDSTQNIDLTDWLVRP